jgi:anti-anti-sigma factor
MAGVLEMIPQPRIGGGSGTALLHCWIEACGDVVVVHVEGEVDLSTAPWLEDTVACAFQKGDGVIVDLARVSYLDGSGLAVLQRAAESHAAHLAVAWPSPRVRRLFDIVHLTEMIPLVGSLEAGRRYLQLTSKAIGARHANT